MILLEGREFPAWPPPRPNAMVKVERPQEAGKIKEIDPSPEPPGRNADCHYLDFSLVDVCGCPICITIR